MNRGMRAALALILALILGLPLAGCRVRTTDGGAATANGINAAGGAAASEPAEDAPAEDESGDQARDNPEAARRIYDDNAPVEIEAGADRLVQGPGEGGGAPVAEDEAEQSAVQLDEGARETATQTVPAETAEKKGVSEDAKAADSAQTYFDVLLEDRLGALFECQRLEAYWETSADHVTVHKSSPEHQLILAAGCYDVSARLLAENLTVDDGWVARKNPGLIVKLVDGGALGRGVASTGAAKAARDALMAREGWAGVDAVRSGRVLLLSEEVMDAPYLRTFARLAMAKTALPDLFGDVDLEEALSMLAEEATGAPPSGVYCFAGN